MTGAAWENLHKAALELAKSSALKQRLTDAYSRYLEDMLPEQLPEGLRGEYQSLRQRMTAVRPLRGETAVAATVRKMSLDEADACAARIVALLDAVHRADLPARRRNRGAEPAEAPQLAKRAPRRDAPPPVLISINRA